MNIFSQNEILSMVWQAGPMVKLVMLLLLAFSVVSWSIIFMKYRMIRRARKETNQFQEIFWRSRSLATAFGESKDLTFSPVAELFRVAVAPELRRRGIGGALVAEFLRQARGRGMRSAVLEVGAANAAALALYRAAGFE
ncbi:MAG: GNAT family N-acetyltransferase, partial [Desulfobacterota bacterium]|nr:GNAT family N-acetyltransferase [Thermodesulfobacteriota bacterium]